MVRYEHDAPGDVLHIHTNMLRRSARPSHRATANRRDSVDGAGWKTLFVAIDDHARIAFTAMHPDETKHKATTRNGACSTNSLGRSVHIPTARALYPVGSARVGLWLEVPELSQANRGPGGLAASLQLASTA